MNDAPLPVAESTMLGSPDTLFFVSYAESLFDDGISPDISSPCILLQTTAVVNPRLRLTTKCHTSRYVNRSAIPNIADAWRLKIGLPGSELANYVVG